MPKTIHVVPHPNGGWDIKIEGDPISFMHFETKQPAVDNGRVISREKNFELVIHRKDGTIERRDSHGNDPFPPRG